MIAEKAHGTLRERMISWLIDEAPLDESLPYDYDRLRREIRPGDVLLVEGRSRVSNVIRTLTQSPWTHAALYIGRLHDIEDRQLKKMAIRHMDKRENVRIVIESMLGKGTIITPLSSYRTHHIRICRPTGLSAEDAQQVIAYAIRALGKPYSVRKLFDLMRFLLPWSLLPRRWGSSLFHTANGEIESGLCSTLLADAFSSVQFPILPLIRTEAGEIAVIKRNTGLYSPKDFDYSPYFEIIKYPTTDVQDIPYYRRMPWAAQKIYNDHGLVSDAEVKAPEKSDKPSQTDKQASYLRGEN